MTEIGKMASARKISILFVKLTVSVITIFYEIFFDQMMSWNFFCIIHCSQGTPFCFSDRIHCIDDFSNLMQTYTFYYRAPW